MLSINMKSKKLKLASVLFSEADKYLPLHITAVEMGTEKLTDFCIAQGHDGNEPKLELESALP